MNNKRSDIVFWAGIVFIHLVYLVFQMVHKNMYLLDSAEYLIQSENIKEGVFYSGVYKPPYRDVYYSMRPPLYPLFLFSGKLLINSDLFIIFLQTCLSLFNLYGVLLLLKKSGMVDTRRYILLAALIISPGTLIYNNMIMSEILFQTILFWSVYWFFRFISEKKLTFLFYYNLLIGLGILTKPVLIIFLAPNFLLMIYMALHHKKAAIMGFALIPILIFAGYSFRNYKQTGYFHYSSISNLSLLHYNSYYFLISKYGQPAADEFVNSTLKGASEFSSFKEEQQYIQKESMKIIKADLLDYSIFHAKGMAAFFLDPGRFDLYKFLNLEEHTSKGLLYHYSYEGTRGVWNYLNQQAGFILLLLGMSLLSNVFFLGSLIYIVFEKKLDVMLKVLLVLLVITIAFATGPLGASRFKVPLFPIILFTLPFFVNFLILKFRNLFNRADVTA